MTHLPFADRTQAGRLLALELEPWRGDSDLLVLALPRGGVPVAFEVAVALGAELDLLLVRKLGAPFNPELALGAIASGGVRVLNHDIIASYEIPAATIELLTAQETQELRRRARAYRGDRPEPVIAGRTLIVIDDGIATGATMRAAIAALRSGHPRSLIIATPVAPPDTLATLRTLADDVVCLAKPAVFGAIGRFYRNFSQVDDAQVREFLARGWAAHATTSPATGGER